MQKLMDLKIDFAFKQIFGKEGNEDILIAFLNAVLDLPSDQEILSLQRLSTEFSRETPDGKASRLDVLVVTEKNLHINVEIQLNNKYDMEKRTLLYWSRVYMRQIKQGATYKTFAPTITINLLNYRLMKTTERYHTSFRLYENQEKFPLTDVMEIHFLEIPKALEKWKTSKASAEVDRLLRWMLLFEADEHADIRIKLEAMVMQEPVMKRLFEQWEELSGDDSKWYEFEARRKEIMDEYSAMVEAEERGREEEKRGIAKKLLESGGDLNWIADMTGVSIRELKELKAQGGH